MKLPRLGAIMDKEPRFALVQHTELERTTALPAEISYNSLFGIRPNQGGYGCCVSESATEIMQAEAIKHYKPIAFSVSANYAQSQRNAYPNQEPKDDGLPVGAGLGTYQTNGYVLDSVRPFPDPYANPDEAYMLAPVPEDQWQKGFENFTYVSVDNHVESIRLYLATRGPVQIGTYWANSWYYPDATGVLAAPDKIVGGHALCITAYNDHTQMFTVANSWGTSWGVKPFGAASAGWCYLPYRFATQYPDFWPGDVYAVTVKP